MKNNRNRIISLLLALNTLLTVSACSKKDNNEEKDPTVPVHIIDANLDDDIVIIDEGNVVENPKYEYDYDNSVVVLEGEEYEELTTEKFEDLTSGVIAKLTKNYVSVDASEIDEVGRLEFYRNLFGPLNLSSTDIISYVAIVNIDKLAQDNTELLNEIIGEQNADVVMNNADRVVSEIVMYNYNYYYNTHDTSNFIKLSDAVFDPVMKSKVMEIERRVNEEIAYAEDDQELNKLINSLFHDMLDPNSELSYLADGVGNYLDVILEPVRGLFGRDEVSDESRLDENNSSLIKYFVSYMEDEQEYVDNSVVTGHRLNVSDILSDCNKKVLSK